MIFVGYQGIGKSTLAKADNRYIDLESTNFWYDHGDGILKRDDLWYLPYCNIAEDLSRQGYRVFTSSHEVVRNRLKQGNETVYGIYPQKQLKNEWIQKLYDRYLVSGLDKDYKAWKNAEDRFVENTEEISNSFMYHIEIEAMDYDLGTLIDFCIEHC